MNLESVIKLIFIIFILFCIYCYFDKSKEKFAEITVSANGLPLEFMFNTMKDGKEIQNSMVIVTKQQITDNPKEIYEIEAIQTAQEKIKFDEVLKEYEIKAKEKATIGNVYDDAKFKDLMNNFDNTILLNIPNFRYLSSKDVPYFTLDFAFKTLRLSHKMTLFEYLRGKTTNNDTKVQTPIFLSLNEKTLDMNTDISLVLSSENKLAIEFIPDKKAIMVVGFYPSDNLLNLGKSAIPKKEYQQIPHRNYSKISRSLNRKIKELQGKPKCQNNNDFFICGIDGYNYVESKSKSFKQKTAFFKNDKEITEEEAGKLNEKEFTVVTKVSDNVILQNPLEKESEHKYEPIKYDPEQVVIKIEHKETMFIGVADQKLILVNQIPN